VLSSHSSGGEEKGGESSIAYLATHGFPSPFLSLKGKGKKGWGKGSTPRRPRWLKSGGSEGDALGGKKKGGKGSRIHLWSLVDGVGGEKKKKKSRAAVVHRVQISREGGHGTQRSFL